MVDWHAGGQSKRSHEQEVTKRGNVKIETKTLNPELRRKVDAYWRAANYLLVVRLKRSGRRTGSRRWRSWRHSLYGKLAAFASMFYERPADCETIMRSPFEINGSFFDSHRMRSQYFANAYASVDSPAGLAADPGAKQSGAEAGLVPPHPC